MAAGTRGAGPTELDDHVSDRLRHMEDSPSRIKTCTEVTAFSETVDLQAERGPHDTACINTRVDDQDREGTRERERLNRTTQAEGEAGGHDPLGYHRDRPPSVDGFINSDCVQPSSTTNLCDAPARQCADRLDSSGVAFQTTNLGQFLCMTFNTI
jgi:hypothetical protein